MKTKQKTKHPNVPNVRINPELNKYQNTIMFPEKLARVNKMLENENFSEQIRKIMSGK